MATLNAAAPHTVLRKKMTLKTASLSPYVQVKKSSVHALGLYAKRPIAANTRIIEYVGKKVTQKQAESIVSENGCIYLFELNGRYLIDGDVDYNLAKYSNHSCIPNCAIDIVKGHIWLEALRDIAQGEELTYDYGFDRVDWHERSCHCRLFQFGNEAEIRIDF